MVVEYVLCLSFKVTNNQEKYETLLTSSKLVKHFEVEHLKVFIDFHLVLGQVIGEYEARDLMMAKYLDKGQTLIVALKYFGIFYISRCKNVALTISASNDDGQLARPGLRRVPGTSKHRENQRILSS